MLKVEWLGDTTIIDPKYKEYLITWAKGYAAGPSLTPKYGDWAGDKSGTWDCFRDGQVLSAFAKWWNVKKGADLDLGTVASSGVCKNVLAADFKPEHRDALDAYAAELKLVSASQWAADFSPQPIPPAAPVFDFVPQDIPPPQVTCGPGEILVNGVCVPAPQLSLPPATPSSTSSKTPWGLILGGAVVLAGAAAWAMGAFGGAGLAGLAENPRRGEVIPSRRWRHVSGRTASIYGAVPWTGARGNQEKDWTMETSGWTIQWDDGTIGIGRVPFETKAEAQAWLDKERARLAGWAKKDNPRKRAMSPPYSRSATSRYGASMGRRSDSPGDFVGPVTVQEVPLEGDYDPGGAYWGGGPGTQPLFVAYDADGHARYRRASSLAAAKTEFSNEGLQVEAKSDVNLDVFFNAYVEAALFTSYDSDGTPLDQNYSSGDFTKDALKKMRRDTDAFAKAHASLITGEETQAGHDFWFTRNGHGVGFDDGDWPEPAATTLATAAEGYGEQHLEVYRKKIHVM